MNTKFTHEGKPYVSLDVGRLSGPSKFELKRLFKEVHGLDFDADDFHHPDKFRFIYPRDSTVTGNVFWVIAQNDLKLAKVEGEINA
jgi:hypothetical protein